MRLHEAMDISMSHEDVINNNKMYNELLVSIEDGFNVINNIEEYESILKNDNEEYDNETLSNINKVIIDSNVKLGLQEDSMLTLAQEDTSNSIRDRLKKLYVTTVAYIVAAYNKLVNIIKRIFISVTNNVIGYESRIKKLVDDINTINDNSSKYTISSEESKLIYKRFKTLINAYGDIKTVGDLVSIINHEAIEMLHPKVIIKSGSSLLSLTSDFDTMDNNINNIKDLLDDELRHIYSGSSKVDSYFLKLLKKENKEYNGIGICIEYYNGKCSGITNDVDSVYYEELYNDDTIKESIITLDNSKDNLTKLGKYLTNYISNYKNYKTDVDSSIAFSNKLLSNINRTDLNTIFNRNSNLTESDIKKTLKVVRQYTNIVPRIANANIINYISNMKNIYWLANLCYNIVKTEHK